MSRASLVLLSTGLLLSGCPEIDGNGRRATETRELDGFTALESAGSLDVTVEQGDEYSAVISIDSNLVDHVDTAVVGDRLVIGVVGSVGDTLPGPHVRVTVPWLHTATLSGSGSVELSAFEQDESVRLILSGSGEMVFSGRAPEVSADLSGSGDILLAGAADHVALDLSGSGTIDAEELEAETGDIELRGSGEVRATVRESARVALDGSGEIDLFGEPAVELSQSGSGEVHVRP